MHGRTRTEAGTLGGWRVLAAAASLLAVLALGPSAGAQDGADAGAESAGRDAAEAPAEEAEPATPPRAGSAPPPASAGSAPPRAAGEASDDVFVPTEEIAADEEVVFPVDI